MKKKKVGMSKKPHPSHFRVRALLVNNFTKSLKPLHKLKNPDPDCITCEFYKIFKEETISTLILPEKRKYFSTYFLNSNYPETKSRQTFIKRIGRTTG